MSGPPFTAFGTDGPNSSVMNSIMASLNSQFDATRAGAAPATSNNAATTSSIASVTSATAVTGTQSASSIAQATTLSTVPSSSTAINVTSPTASVPQTSQATETGSSAAQNTSGASNGPLIEQDSCDSISCSPGLQAAIAVPVVIGVLGIIALSAFILRRRKRKQQAVVDDVDHAKTNKKWTRHLRMFSFDAELLMGGRFSSSNSLRSGPSSLRGSSRAVREAQTASPSLHSIDEVAPPYRDAVSHAQPPNMTQTGPGMLVSGGLRDSTGRPISSSTAPPPYNPATPTSSRRNPFNDSAPVSPVEGSPFDDPSEGDGDSIAGRLLPSRGSSMHQGPGVDDASSLGGSEAASIHEAQVGRHISVGSSGRTIENVRTSQHIRTPSS